MPTKQRSVASLAGREKTFAKLLALLRKAFNADFTCYKPAPLKRRIRRRMALRRVRSLEAYLQRVCRDRDELEALYGDLLIHVAGAMAHSSGLIALTTEFESLLESVALPLLLLDENLRVGRFTRRAAALLNLAPSDVGRPVSALTPNFTFPQLEEWIAEVKKNLSPREREVQDRAGRWYAMQIRPCKMGSHQLGGAVITWTDITALKLSLQDATAFSQAIVDTARESLLLLDAQLRVKSANRTFYETFRVSPQETEGCHLYDLGDRQWDIPRLHSLLDKVLPLRRVVHNFDVDHEFPHIGRREMRLNARRIESAGEAMILLAIEDVTALKRAKDSLRELSDRFWKVQQEERQRLARELHDTTASNLVDLMLAISQLGKSAPSLDADSRETLNRASALAKRCAREVRTLSYLMHSPVTPGRDLGTALRWYVEGFAERSGVPVEIHLQAGVENPPPRVATALFRVVQESLSNIHRHSGSSSARLCVARTNGVVTVEIRDSGRGIPRGVLDIDGKPGARSGVGLMGMAERVQEVGGRLEIQSGKGGTTVKANLPCE
ncbi:MAG: PAS domain-containing protein [Terriglobia bacterium]